MENSSAPFVGAWRAQVEPHSKTPKKRKPDQDKIPGRALRCYAWYQEGGPVPATSDAEHQGRGCDTAPQRTSLDVYLVAASQIFNSDFAYFCITDMRFISYCILNTLGLLTDCPSMHKNNASPHKQSSVSANH
jgi:hypothetical protein